MYEYIVMMEEKALNEEDETADVENATPTTTKKRSESKSPKKSESSGKRKKKSADSGEKVMNVLRSSLHTNRTSKQSCLLASVYFPRLSLCVDFLSLIQTEKAKNSSKNRKKVFYYMVLHSSLV